MWKLRNSCNHFFFNLPARSIRAFGDISPAAYWINTSGKTLFSTRIFQAKKNERKREIEDLHIKINQLQHCQALDPSVDLSPELYRVKATLNKKLRESAHFASKHKFASDLQASERCSKFFFWSPQILHMTPIPLDSVEDLESTCATFNQYWSRIYRSPSREYGHAKPNYDCMGLSQLLMHTTSRLTPANRAYMDSPFTDNYFYWSFKHMSSGKTPGPDSLPLDYYHVNLPLWSRISEVIYDAQFQKGEVTKFQRRD